MTDDSQPVARSRRRRQAVTNEQAKLREQMRTMSVVGIGSRFHDMRLRDFAPEGERLQQVLTELWTADNIKAGAGMTVLGGGRMAGDLHMMLARSLHLVGASVLVLGLSEVSRRVQWGEEDEDGPTMTEVQALFIRNFQTERACPLRDYQLAGVTDMLDERLNRCAAVFPWLTTESNLWWPDSLLAQLSERNVVFEVGQ